MNQLTTIFAATLLAMTTHALSAATFFVAPDGNDANPGTEAKPFATLPRARDAVRQLKQAGPLAEPITVLVRDGAYRLGESLTLDARDAGTAAAPVTWQAAGKDARLYGGATLPADALRPVTDQNVLARLDPAARGKVLWADLRALGVTELGSLPDNFRGAPTSPEVFFNDQRLALACWPNEGWTTIAKIIDSGSIPRVGDNSNRPGVFEYEGDRPERWNVDAGVWLQGYWCYDWYEEIIRVKAIDREKHQITLTTPTVYGVKQGNPSPRRYRALNLLEELDRPGEFYIDRAVGRLYLWPPSDPASARIVLSTLNSPLVLLADTENVVLRGFIVEAGLGSGIQVSGGRDNRIEACEVRNMRLLGIHVSGGTGHRVVGSAIHDTGTGGLVLEGGDRKTLTPGGHEALDNHIWQFSRHQFTSAYGLILGGVGNRAAHNLVHDAPHQAIALQGNDHVFEYNVVRNVVTETDDAGALYKGRNPSCRGNLIRYNFWHDIGSPMGHGTAAVYFDDGDGGDTVFGNVFLRCGYPGRGSFGTVFSHGGHDNRAENNIFIDCQRAIGSAPWPDDRWKRTVDGGEDCFWQERLLKDVDITKPPYTTRYPELVGFMQPQPGQPRVNRAKNNVLVRCGDVTSGNWTFEPAEIWSTGDDPGFVDAAHDNYQLRADAEVFKHLPGFQPIPFDKIGPRKGAEIGAKEAKE
ncbi:MAG: right-handed parallel beta-helix repeat-containing protein [Planctomycetia bacterium]|nr:right-handed parallel beta-helix repeat-containing protein [Planctomycetia bacterium]